MQVNHPFFTFLPLYMGEARACFEGHSHQSLYMSNVEKKVKEVPDLIATSAAY